ncbi:MAG: hypothetical protein R3227_04705 [Reinekea sp.]|jgi:hypothetical protein|nr:hypothetical protein [Reinekea sp.]
MGFTAVAFSLDVLFSALSVWLATHLRVIQMPWRDIGILVISVSVVSVIPVIGLLLGILLFLVMVLRFSGCSVVNAAALVGLTKLAWLMAVAVFGSSFLN